MGKAPKDGEPMDEVPHYLRKRSYLTRGDKILFVVLVLIAVPLGTLGLPYLGLAAVLVLSGAILAMTARRFWHLLRGRPAAPEQPARYVNLTRLQSDPQKIRHGYSASNTGRSTGSGDDKP